LPHRSLFEARLREEVRRARRDRVPFALMILDLDFFKLINETLGQRWGNQILQRSPTWFATGSNPVKPYAAWTATNS
jgi:diguanylate cyclase (GGDEF)-like protein